MILLFFLGFYKLGSQLSPCSIWSIGSESDTTSRSQHISHFLLVHEMKSVFSIEICYGPSPLVCYLHTLFWPFWSMFASIHCFITYKRIILPNLCTFIGLGCICQTHELILPNSFLFEDAKPTSCFAILSSLGMPKRQMQNHALSRCVNLCGVPYKVVHFWSAWIC